MLPKVEELINQPRNSVRERVLARELRKLPESSRFEFIESVLAHKREILGLQLAKSVLRNKDYFERLLYQGLEHANASSIRDWLACVIPRLGSRRVIATLKKEMVDKPEAVCFALYWLPSLIDADHRTQGAYRELLDQAKLLKIREKTYSLPDET